jgi:hypothetical protein
MSCWFAEQNVLYFAVTPQPYISQNSKVVNTEFPLSVLRVFIQFYFCSRFSLIPRFFRYRLPILYFLFFLISFECKLYTIKIFNFFIFLGSFLLLKSSYIFLSLFILRFWHPSFLSYHLPLCAFLLSVFPFSLMCRWNGQLSSALFGRSRFQIWSRRPGILAGLLSQHLKLDHISFLQNNV